MLRNFAFASDSISEPDGRYPVIRTQQLEPHCIFAPNTELKLIGIAIPSTRPPR